MLQKQGPRTVLVLLLGITALELGMAGKFGRVFSLAFYGQASSKGVGTSGSF